MKTILVSLFSFIVITGYSQNQPAPVDNNPLPEKTKIFPLKDPTTGNLYMVDSEKVFVYLINQQGEISWKKDPFSNCSVAKYYQEKPIITNFHFSYDEPIQVIYIGYSNGVILSLTLKTGEFEVDGTYNKKKKIFEPNGRIFGVRRLAKHL